MIDITKISEEEIISDGTFDSNKLLEKVNKQIGNLNMNVNELHRKHNNLKNTIFFKINTYFENLEKSLKENISSEFSKSKKKLLEELKNDLEIDENENMES